MGRCEPPSAIGSAEIRRLERDPVTVFVVGEQDQSNVASLRRRGATLTVRSPSPMARRIFEVSALDALFDERSLSAAPRAGRRPSSILRRRCSGPATDDPGSMAAAIGALRVGGTCVRQASP